MSVPIIIIYLLSFMAFSTLGICESVFVIYCYHHEGNSAPPKWLDANRIMSETCKKITEEDKEAKQNDGEISSSDITWNNKERWQKIGLLTDQICFWLYVFMFTVLTLLTLVILPRLGRLEFK